MALTKVTEGIRTLGTDEVIATNIATDAVTTGKILDDNVTIAKIAGSASAAADTFLKKDGTWSAVASGIEWQAVQTTGFTAVAGKGYPCNTTASAFTVTLPASASVGDEIAILDYAGTFDTNNLTINPNGLKLKGNTVVQLASTEREGFTITYVDVTQGWVATSGVNTGSPALAPYTYDIEWLVVAGGGGGACGIAVSGKRAGGGGGGGGYKNSFASEASGGGASTETKITGIGTGVVLTATVGPGGVGGFGSGDPGDVGVDSSLAGTGIVTITSAGGGLGNTQYASGGAGGSGGGAAGTNGTANTGGGGGGQGDGTDFDSGQGGVGIIILRMLTAHYSTTVTGSPTVAVDGSHTVVTFTGDGSYTT